MALIDAEELTDLRARAAVTRIHESTLRAALELRIDHFTREAATAQEGYQAGQDDPETKAAQDASMVTNNGYRMSAKLFTQEADNARAALVALNMATDPNYYSEEEN